MVFVRRRYYFWLFRAYVRRWRKTIAAAILIGVAAFFFAIIFFNQFIQPAFSKKTEKIGYWGVYTPKTIPESVLSELSYGLTKIDSHGNVIPGAADKWTTKNNGKTFIFHIKPGQYFNNKTELTTKTLPLAYKDVKRQDMGLYAVSFTLKSPYAPFLANVSKPILYKNSQGLGQYKLGKIDLNGGFVKQMTLVDKSEASRKQFIYFYPTQEALKTAFLLGDVDRIINVNDTISDSQDLSKWKNVETKMSIDYEQLVTLFFNVNNPELSNKKTRQALVYALPPIFSKGERAESFIPPTSIYFSKSPSGNVSNRSIAATILSDTPVEKTITISVLEDYVDVAKEVQSAWKKAGIKSTIKTTRNIPDTFQVLIYPIKLPKDPDSYSLWHSAQVNNIVGYKSVRIDKLLEDGRQTTEVAQRISIYADLQKYLLDDAPAAFLYYPYSYTLSRR